MIRSIVGLFCLCVFAPQGAIAQEGSTDTPKQAEEEWSIDTANPDGTPIIRFEHEATEGTWMSVDVSPDGETIVFDLLGHLFEMPIAGGAATALTEGRSWNLMPRFSPDGSEIAFTSDRDGVDNIWILNRESGDLENLTKSAEPVVRGTWSSDGRQVLAARYPKALTLHGMMYDRFGQKQELVESALFRFANQFVDDGERGFIYYEHNNGNLPSDGARIYKYDKSTGESAIFIQRAGGGAFNPQLSPDGKRLAFMGATI